MNQNLDYQNLHFDKNNYIIRLNYQLFLSVFNIRPNFALKISKTKNFALKCNIYPKCASYI